nr:ABC transporter permease [Cohnella pontilimi]
MSELPLHGVNQEQALLTRGARRYMVELGILFRIQFSIIRDSWVWVILMASMFPFMTLMFMRFFMTNPTPDMIIRSITGNMLFGVIAMGMNGMAQEISWQKHQGHFTFYAALPISKFNFVLANLIRGLISNIPSVIILAIIGQLVYGVTFHYSWGLIPVLLLSIFSIVGIGVCLGFSSPNHQLTNMLSQVLMMVVTFLTPIMMDIHQLPKVLQWFSYIFPSTYAAEALQQILLTGWTTVVTRDALILSGFSVVCYLVINKSVSWRVNK